GGNPCSAAINAALGSATASDACGTVTLTSSDSPVSGTCAKSQTRTWTATNACGNTVTTSRTITWSSTGGTTVITVTGGPALGCNPSTSAIDAALGSATASNACGTVTLTSSDSPVSGTCAKSQTRTWTATDACGNTVTTSRTVTWSSTGGTTVITVTGGPALGCNPSSSAIDAALGSATASNACGTVTLTSSDSPVSGSCAKSQTRTWTATDACGSTVTTSRTVTWSSTGGTTVITVTGGPALGCNPSSSAIDAALGSATASNACGTVTVTSSDNPVSGSCVKSQ